MICSKHLFTSTYCSVQFILKSLFSFTYAKRVLSYHQYKPFSKLDTIMITFRIRTYGKTFEPYLAARCLKIRRSAVFKVFTLLNPKLYLLTFFLNEKIMCQYLLYKSADKAIINLSIILLDSDNTTSYNNFSLSLYTYQSVFYCIA